MPLTPKKCTGQYEALCIFSFNQDLKGCATYNKQFQSPTTLSPFRRLDYDWLVPELGLLTEMWSLAITHSHGGNNLSKEGSELHLQYAPALSRPWQIWNAAIPSSQSLSPRVNMRQTKQIHLFYLLKEYKGTGATCSRSAEQVTACYMVAGHDWKRLGYAPTILTAEKKQCYGKALYSGLILA